MPLTPANCAGYVERAGIDANDNGILEDTEITTTTEIDEEGTPLTRDKLVAMIDRGTVVIAANTCRITNISNQFKGNTTFNQPIGNCDVSSVSVWS